MEGKCKVEVSATVNVGNYQSVKATVSFEESYEEGDAPASEVTPARELKFYELLGIANDKLDAAVVSTVKHLKKLKADRENLFKTVQAD